MSKTKILIFISGKYLQILHFYFKGMRSDEKTNINILVLSSKCPKAVHTLTVKNILPNKQTTQVVSFKKKTSLIFANRNADKFIYQTYKTNIIICLRHLGTRQPRNNRMSTYNFQ